MLSWRGQRKIHLYLYKGMQCVLYINVRVESELFCLLAGQPRNRLSILRSFQTDIGIHLRSYSIGSGGSTYGVKGGGSEANNSPSNTVIKNAWSCIFTPPIRLHGVERFSWAFIVFGFGAKIENCPFLSKSSYMIGNTKHASLRFMGLSLIIIIINIYLSWRWATCWPVPVSRIQKSLQGSAMIPSASWGIAFHYPG